MEKKKKKKDRKKITFLGYVFPLDDGVLGIDVVKCL